MDIKGLLHNMSLQINHHSWDSYSLPWDLRTIFDCALSLDDVETLQSGSILQIGEIQMRLIKEESCGNN